MSRTLFVHHIACLVAKNTVFITFEDGQICCFEASITPCIFAFMVTQRSLTFACTSNEYPRSRPYEQLG